MTYKIKKGKHRAWPISIGLFYDRESISKTICFDDSCRYVINDDDKYDTNKLFGIGYLWSHTKDSARFGWRFNPDSDDITLSAYCYVDKERVIWPLLEVKFGKEYDCTLVITKDSYMFLVFDAATKETLAYETIAKFHNKKFGYKLGVYFGGNKSAPKTMKIKMSTP